MIRKNKQLIVSNTNGDCLRACLSSILGIENSKHLPNIDSPLWQNEWEVFLRGFGLRFSYESPALWPYGFWIASVPSKNFLGSSHAIIMKDTKVWFDPSPLKRYRAGSNLLGTKIVLGGFYLHVADTSLLHNLVSRIGLKNPKK